MAFAADGRMVLPFMPFADLSDDDLTAVISYVRTMPAVSHAVAPHSPNAAGTGGEGVRDEAEDADAADR